MTNRVWPADAVGGAPAYSGRAYRQVHASILAGATAARPLGARSGVRIGTPATTVTATSTTWTVKPHAGIIDAQAAAEAGAYWYAIDANVTGSITAAHATLPRRDIVWVRIDDPAESDGSSVPAAVPGYTAGTAAASPVAPTKPARTMVLAEINVPAAGGGAPTVTWVAPYTAASGGIIPARSASELAAIASLGTADSPIIIDYAGALYRAAGGTARAVGTVSQHAETTGPTPSFAVQSGQVWGLGAQTLDVAASIDPPGAPGSEGFTVNRSGIYAVSAFIKYGSIVNVRSLVDLNVGAANVARSVITGDDQGSVSVPALQITAGQVVKATVYQASGSIQQVTSRLRVTLLQAM